MNKHTVDSLRLYLDQDVYIPSPIPDEHECMCIGKMVGLHTAIEVFVEYRGYQYDLLSEDVMPVLKSSKQYLKEHPNSDLDLTFVSKTVKGHLNIKNLIFLIDNGWGAIPYEKSETGYCDIISYHQGLFLPCTISIKI